MKVTLQIAGGLAPPLMSRQYVVDTTRLEESQRKALAALVDQALAEPHRDASRALRDARSYEIRVATDAGEKTVVAYDGAMPAATQQLVEMLKSLAQK